MRIANNISAKRAFNELDRTNMALSKSIQNLTSGLRINSSADDAAGFAISEKMRAQISGLDTVIQSTQDGISLLQTAEGAMSQTNSMLMRMRELAVQASNDSLTSQDRQFIQLEIDELRNQINNIANTTQFNNKRILDGSSGAMWSSSDINLKATINKGLISVDEFGQKINHEGNYRIQITAEPGQAQVQKSNIMNVARTEFESKTETFTKNSNVETIKTFTEKTILTEEEEEISIILDGGSNGEAISSVKEAVNLDEITSGWDFDSSNYELTIKEDGLYRITGTNSMLSTKNHIVIAEGINAQIILDGVNINTSSMSNCCAFEVKPGAKAEIFLANTNRLKSSNGRAGIEVTGSVNGSGSDAEVVINSATSPANSLDGVLEVTGGSQAAAIGGPGNPAANGRPGNITINGGTILAMGGTDASGIGGGYTSGYNGGGSITINGGDVTAISPLDAGIGTGLCGITDSGHNNGGTVITITGGKVKAKGGGGAGAGIGGGLNFWSGVIKIKSGITIIEDSPASSDASFLQKAKQLTEDNTGDFVYAVKGSYSTAAIGHGASAGDTPNGIDLDADLPDPVFPDVPDNPTALVKEHSVILEEHVEYITNGEDEIITSEAVKEIKKDLTLDEISQFHTDGGASIVEPYKNIKIIQGNGQSAEVTIYPTDTMYSVAEKINDAIASTLGQGAYTDVNNKFCTISDGTANTSEAVYSTDDLYDDEVFKRDENGNYALDENGNRIPIANKDKYKGKDIYATMLVRSAIPGKEGELYFSADNDLLNALGLNTIQESSESTFIASAYNAHTGQPVATNVKATDSAFVSLIPPDVDISVDAMAGVSANWDDTTKRFIWARKENYEAMIHLKNNGIAFQTGANKGEDFMIDLGDMSSEALDLSGVNVLTRESASRSISIIDKAIKKVSGQRAKIGAYENALENTMNNLKTTSLNITAADSRIRDADMAQEMMKFVKYQILNQSGTSMLAQANQMPSSVQSLFQQ